MTSADFPDIIRLWEEAFGDLKEYIEFFLNRQFKERFSYVLKEDDKVLAMTHIFPCEICVPSKCYKFAYEYAVATFKKHRGNGIAEELLRKIHQDLKSMGYFGCFLFPADEHLFKYYHKLGYEIAGYSKVLEFQYKELFTKPRVERLNENELMSEFNLLDKIKHIEYVKCEDMSDEQKHSYAIKINDIRKHHYRNYNYEHWDLVGIKFIIDDACLEKRRIMFFEYQSHYSYVIWKINGFEVIISEIAIDEESFKKIYEEIIFAIMRFYGFHFIPNFEKFDISLLRFRFTLPYWFEIGERIPKAMIYYFDKSYRLNQFMPNNNI